MVVAELPPILSIREVSQRSGCAASALRYYETQGMITALPRDSMAARMYPASVLHALSVITTLRDAGFGIQDIRKLLETKQPDESLFARVEQTLAVLGDFTRILQEQRRATLQAEQLVAEWQRELRELAESLETIDQS